jgi:hypothetical protein
MRTDPLEALLAFVVLIHLVVAAVHGSAHGGAHVALTPVALAFVIVVIQIAPLVGVWLSRSRPLGGAWLFTASMAGALVFGVVNHFVLPGSDNVGRVDAQWRALFASTAALLALIEASGTIVGVVAVRRYARRVS